MHNIRNTVYFDPSIRVNTVLLTLITTYARILWIGLVLCAMIIIIIIIVFNMTSDKTQMKLNIGLKCTVEMTQYMSLYKSRVMKLQSIRCPWCAGNWCCCVVAQVGQPRASGSAGIDTQPKRAKYGSFAAKQRVKPGTAGSDGATYCTRNTDGTSAAVSQLVLGPGDSMAKSFISQLVLACGSFCGFFPRC